MKRPFPPPAAPTLGAHSPPPAVPPASRRGRRAGGEVAGAVEAGRPALALLQRGARGDEARAQKGCSKGHTAIHRVPNDVLQDVFNTPNA